MNKSKEHIVIDQFIKLSQVPRPSQKEKQFQQYLLDFSKRNKLKAIIETESGNVIIKKKASKGKENSPTVILQSHMDMVCQKDQDSIHNFEIDPIKVSIKDGMLVADKTTLGADNGIGLAYMLSILESKDIEHPAIEALFTTSEETTMKGAEFLNSKNLNGSLLLNLDGEEEGVFLVSSAGGVNHSITLEAQSLLSTKKGILKIELLNLKGGHSGIEIHKNHANAIVTLVRVLEELSKFVDYSLININGGNAVNAIPVYAQAEINLSLIDIHNTKELILDLVDKKMSAYDDCNQYKINITESSNESGAIKVVDVKDKLNLFNLITSLQSGVIRYSDDIENFVITSQNIGLISLVKDKFYIDLSVRSSDDEDKNKVTQNNKALVERLNGTFETKHSYPGWAYKSKCDLRDKAITIYRTLFNKDAKVEAIHAGLECGFLSDKLSQNHENGIDIISFGPNLKNVHTTSEQADVASIIRIYDFIKELLASL